MPYINTSRSATPTTTDYVSWQQALDVGLHQLARKALGEPGVTSVELVDDCRSRVLFVEKECAGVLETSDETRERPRAPWRNQGDA